MQYRMRLMLLTGVAAWLVLWTVGVGSAWAHPSPTHEAQSDRRVD